MRTLLRHLFSSWAWRMAWRDSRPARWRLLLFSMSIVFGVAALVTIGSLRQNLNEAVGNQAKSLLGADLMLSSRQPFSDETQKMFTDLGGEQALEISFTTMMQIGDNTTPKLVGMRGMEAKFPFYGMIETDPPNAWQTVQTSPGLIVEESFLKSLNAKVGDNARFGNQTLPIAGVLRKAPPTASGFAAFAPAALVPIDVIAESKLIGARSLMFFRRYFKFPAGFDTEALVEKRRDEFKLQNLRYTSSKKRRENIEKAIDRLYGFLNLVGFSALFLGGIGVAGAIHVHISERLKSVATLRCLGCTAPRAFAVYLAQGIAMGVAGTIAGIAVGSILVWIVRVIAAGLPASLIPFPVEIAPSVTEILKAGGIGFAICVTFALLPLLAVRKVSPLAALRREAIHEHTVQGRDPLRWLILAVLAAFAFGMTWWDTHNLRHGWKTALGYTGFLAVAFLFLAGAGRLLRWIAGHIIRPSWPYVVRQGFASLYRPNNQTNLFMLSIGLGVFLIFTLILVQNLLLQWLDPARLEDKPNIFLVDIDPDRNTEVDKLIDEAGVRRIGEAPIVLLRLTEIKGRPVSEIITDKKKKSDIPEWILRREFRSTFRDALAESEKLTEGQWIGSAEGLGKDEAIPISIEEKTARDLKLEIGDEITMSIEGFGESLKLRIASLREVDWRSMNLNFFIVFPRGVLEDYVSFNIMSAHSPSPESTARLQQSLFKDFPMVNSIDVSLILKTVQSVLQAVGTAVQVMALFTVLTGVVVLIGSILAGRRVRIEESILLRTLGASRSQISRVLAVEYALLAAMATLAGTALALVASYLIGWQVFEGEPFTMEVQPVVIAGLVIMVLTIMIGMLLSRGVTKQPPLEILRAEG